MTRNSDSEDKISLIYLTLCLLMILDTTTLFDEDEDDKSSSNADYRRFRSMILESLKNEKSDLNRLSVLFVCSHDCSIDLRSSISSDLQSTVKSSKIAFCQENDTLISLYQLQSSAYHTNRMIPRMPDKILKSISEHSEQD